MTSPFGSPPGGSIKTEILNPKLADISTRPVPPPVPAVSPMAAITAKMGTKSQQNLPAIQVYSIPINNDDISALGREVSDQASATTDKIIEKFKLNRFGELGDLMTELQVTSQLLDPDTILKNGVAGWWQRKFTNVEALFQKNFATAESSFDKMVERGTKFIATLETWDQELDAMKLENYNSYVAIMGVINQGKQWAEQARHTIDNFPIIAGDDSEGPMKMQLRRDQESKLNRLLIKIDFFERLKQIRETTNVRISAQQEQSNNSVHMISEFITNVIRPLKFDFVLYMQNGDLDKSVQFYKAGRKFANDVLKKGVDATAKTVIDAAQAYNDPFYSNDTLAFLRNRMKDAQLTVKKIESDAEVRRREDAVKMQQDQAEYLAALQGAGAKL